MNSAGLHRTWLRFLYLIGWRAEPGVKSVSVFRLPFGVQVVFWSFVLVGGGFLDHLWR